MTKSIQFTLNGKPQSVDCRADMTVLEWLRIEALLRGTKEGCAEGDCGACSVLLKRAGDENYLPANSCIMLLAHLNGGALMTVEGLAQSSEDGHVIQQKMAENGSSQCGFCTPGIVSALAGLLEQNDNPDDNAVHEAMAGNLCRCTGYRPIVEAAQAAARAKGDALPKVALAEPSSEPVGQQSQSWSPKTLGELSDLRTEHSDAVVLAGGTDIALSVAHARSRWPKIILTRNVGELRELRETETSLEIGGAVTWGECLPVLDKHWPSFAKLVRRFGSVQIRTMGTVAGNLGTASPIGDGAPSLLSLGASLVLFNGGSERTLPLDDFFLGYRQSALQEGEIIQTIQIPLPTQQQQFRVYKISKRYDQDISTVCGAFCLEMDGEKVSAAKIAFGGMAAVPLRIPEVEEVLAGSVLNEKTLSEAKATIRAKLAPMSDMRGSADYRLQVAGNLMDRFAMDVAGETVEVMAL